MIKLLKTGALIALLSTLAVTQSATAGVSEGQELYRSYCVVCHGDLGQGQTMGKPLTDNNANRLSDAELIDVISNGRAGTGMAAWGSSLTEQDLLDIAGFVRVLQGGVGLTEVNENAVADDDPAVLAGALVFNGSAGCIDCHSYADQGGNIGPELDGVAARLGDAGLLEALLDPSAAVDPGFGVKIVTQTDGSQIKGRYRYDSEFAVQIMSDDGKRWVTYFKERVESVEDSEESLMPQVYARLSGQEQEDLLAFLRSL